MVLVGKGTERSPFEIKNRSGKCINHIKFQYLLVIEMSMRKGDGFHSLYVSNDTGIQTAMVYIIHGKVEEIHDPDDGLGDMELLAKLRNMLPWGIRKLLDFAMLYLVG